MKGRRDGGVEGRRDEAPSDRILASKGRAGVAMGKRSAARGNDAANQVRPNAAEAPSQLTRDVSLLLCPSGAVLATHTSPRVPLRCTRGYNPLPLRGIRTRRRHARMQRPASSVPPADACANLRLPNSTPPPLPHNSNRDAHRPTPPPYPTLPLSLSVSPSFPRSLFPSIPSSSTPTHQKRHHPARTSGVVIALLCQLPKGALPASYPAVERVSGDGESQPDRQGQPARG